jgi:molybdopterin-guanine dinucleotide biosynthesis protein
MSTAPNPYPGLRSFEPHEADRFFGRDQAIGEVLRKLRRHRLVAITGSSGSGKSSLIKAGVLPRLQRGFRIGTNDAWHITQLRPGADPIRSLAQALTPADASDSVIRQHMLRAALARGSQSLIAVIKQIGFAGNHLVLVDQFEELFRLSAEDNKDIRSAFVQLLLSAAAQHTVPIHIIITMRADFLGDCAQYRGLTTVINNGLFITPRMERDERRQVIEGPARAAGLELSPLLVQTVLNEWIDDQDQLPILQHALMRTCEWWQKNPAGPIEVEHYRAIGGMRQALDRQGDEALQHLTEPQRQLASKLFKRLTVKGRDNRERRTPCSVADLRQSAQSDGQSVRQVLNQFRQQGLSFLLPGPTQPLDDKTIIDISHESLMRVWRTLRHWVEEEAEAARQLRLLAERAERYRAGEDSRLAQPALQIFVGWRQRQHPNEAWGRRYRHDYQQALAFLEESEQNAEEAARAEAEAGRQALAQAQRLARARRWMTWMASACTALALVVLVQVWQMSEGHRRSERAMYAKQEAAAAILHLKDNNDPTPALQQALKATAQVNSIAVHTSEKSATVDALNRCVQAARRRIIYHGGQQQRPMAAAFRIDSNRVETLYANGVSVSWNLRDGTHTSTRLRPAGEAQVILAQAHPDKGWVSIWNDNQLYIDEHHHDIGETPRSLATNANASHIFLGMHDGGIQVFSSVAFIDNWQAFPKHETIESLGCLPDGTILAGSQTGDLRLIDATGTSRLQSDGAHQSAVHVLLPLSNNHQFVSAGYDGHIKLWSRQNDSLTVIHDYHRPQRLISQLVELPSNRGALIASHSWNQDLRVWDLHRDDLVVSTVGPSYPQSMLVDLKDDNIAAIGADGSLQVQRLRLIDAIDTNRFNVGYALDAANQRYASYDATAQKLLVKNYTDGLDGEPLATFTGCGEINFLDLLANRPTIRYRFEDDAQTLLVRIGRQQFRFILDADRLRQQAKALLAAKETVP